MLTISAASRLSAQPSDMLFAVLVASPCTKLVINAFLHEPLGAMRALELCRRPALKIMYASLFRGL